MPRIIVRARDSALAMEEVIRQLGPDAYIIATRQQGGMVEIEAATDPGAAEDVSLTLPPGGVPAGSRLEAARAAAIAALSDLIPLAPDGLAAELTHPAYPEPMTRRLLAALRAERALGPNLAQTLLPLHPFDLAAWSTLVLVGPAGGGRSLVAVKIAAEILERGAPLGAPVLIAPDDPPCEDRLWRLSVAMGVALYRPTLEGVARLPAVPRIIDMPASDRAPQTTAAAVRALRDAGRAEVLLVLPADLSPDRTARECRLWHDLADHVLLTRLDHGPPGAEMLQALAAHGLTVALVTGTRAPLAALRAPGPADLMAPAAPISPHIVKAP